MYFAYLDYSKSMLLIRKQGYVIENDNNMIPHLKNQQNKPIAKNQTLLWLEFQVQHITSLIINVFVIVAIPVNKHKRKTSKLD
jgi:hypothetical protein